MLDFLMIGTKSTQKGVLEIYPKFIIGNSNDLMIRGRDFYAIWVESKGLWSTDEQDAVNLVDAEIREYAEKHKNEFDSRIKLLLMRDAESGIIDAFHKYCQKQMRDRFHNLDENLIFANTPVNKKDYASKRLSYSLEPTGIDSYKKLMSTLYTEDELHKIEWAIGSIVCGESKKLQKFMVLYGSGGTGKSTVINIIQELFDEYYTVFDAKALGSSSATFALESFKNNPLVAIQHDGDLSKIEDNTRLNSLVSHELMQVNEKFKPLYPTRFKCFLFMGTNKPVKITDSRSGLIRRLIDVSPSGNLVENSEYLKLVKNIKFELGGIALHCQDVYLSNTHYYDDYIPIAMLGASNDFYNFMVDSYFVFQKEDGTTLKQAWEMYKVYCDEAKVAFPFSQRNFKEELKNYFWEFKERSRVDEGRARNYYSGFRTDKFEQNASKNKKPSIKKDEDLLILNETKSVLDEILKDCPAQYATSSEKPLEAWDVVKTTLRDLDTTKLHYVRPELNHIVIDFDLVDEKGEKSYERNLQAASSWPKTYAELSKGGSGIHLHYYYTGDVSLLEREYAKNIEIKVFSGKSSLRRKLTKCNALAIAVLSSGLPVREEKSVVKDTEIKSEFGLRKMIERNLKKEIHPATKPSIEFIKSILDDAYKSGMKYDVSDMHSSILGFAMHSSHQAAYCVKLVSQMKFASETELDSSDNLSGDEPLVFFDVEVFPNLFICNWKFQGDKKVMRMINPSPRDIEKLIKFKLVGFNNRDYDNHILYARLLGYTNEQLYELSQKIIKNVKGCKFGEAYNLSYTDIYDFASAGNKMSLKKWEIKLGLHHKELGLPWDKPVPEDKWIQVAEYCDNDVIASEAVFEHLKGDWMARQILAEITGRSVNDTTNTLSARFIFGNNKNPQNKFNWRDLSVPTDDGKPWFKGYTFKNGVSTYKDKVVSEGGYVAAIQGMYTNVAVLDVASMHPTSVEQENLFGDEYTAMFSAIKKARIAIKRKDFEAAKLMLGGMLAKYLDDPAIASALADALKTVINSVYGLTFARFDNPFRDKRNVDNIVAKRGALFMVDLQEAVTNMGFTVAHIKTDSIKIPNATPEIIQFVMDFGAKYGYEFEHESTYEKMCLVNDAVYIAKYLSPERCKELYGYVPGNNKKSPNEWTATGTQFAVPYVFKTLFSHEPIVFADYCETKSVTSSLYLDMNEGLDISALRSDGTPKTDEDYHNYVFVGRVGSFCPMKAGAGGGLLLRESTDKEGNVAYHAATSSKGFRWMEAEMVTFLKKEDQIDTNYFNQKVNDAVDALAKYGDVEWFLADDSINNEVAYAA